MSRYQYVFKDTNNGYYSSYQPFTSKKELTQEDAIKMIEKHGPGVYRLGGGIKHLVSVANDLQYDIKPYHSIYIKPEEGPFTLIIGGDPGHDPLPKEFYDWKVIEGISGNY